MGLTWVKFVFDAVGFCKCDCELLLSRMMLCDLWRTRLFGISFVVPSGLCTGLVGLVGELMLIRTKTTGVLYGKNL
jgi:hypothetical protein